MSRTCWAAAAAATLLLAGCQGGTPPEPTDLPSTPTVTAEPTTPTPTPTPTLSAEEEAAMQAVIDFWKVRDELASDPELDLTRLSEVARSQALEVHRSSLATHAGHGLRQVGSVEVVPTTARVGEGAGQYVVTACVDVSNVDVVDADGKSEVPSGRRDVSEYDYTVERDDDQWFVVEDLLEAKDC